MMKRRKPHYVRKQSGFVISEKRDRGRRALRPGLRISKNGNLYFESRINRSDLNPKQKW